MAGKINVVIWGYCVTGIEVFEKVRNLEQYEFIGFADNSVFKQGNYVDGKPVYSMDQLCKLKKEKSFSVIIAVGKWNEVERECNQREIRIEAVYMRGEMHQYPFPSFASLDYTSGIKFYAGNICDEIHKNSRGLYGLSLRTADSKHIIHDVREKYPVPDNSIEAYEAEDVFEYVEKESQIDAINEIYRILKPQGYVRFTLPDYNSPYLKRRTMCDSDGKCSLTPWAAAHMGQMGFRKMVLYIFQPMKIFKRHLRKRCFRG